MKNFIFILFCVAPLVWGCSNDPFNVAAPVFRDQTGTALVSVSIPAFSRGLIQRVSIEVTAADTGRIRKIQRDMNFPIPGGNLAVGQVANIPAGRRRFVVAAFDTADTKGVPRFRGFSDSTVFAGQTQLVQVRLNRIGGAVNFQAVLDSSNAELDSVSLAKLPLTSVLDILELIPDPFHADRAMLPLASVALGDRFTPLEGGAFSRRITVAQIPTGSRRFVARLKDLSSGGTRAYADTVVVEVDTVSTKNAVFELTRVKRVDELDKIFNQPTLPADSTVVVIVPQF